MIGSTKKTQQFGFLRFLGGHSPRVHKTAPLASAEQRRKKKRRASTVVVVDEDDDDRLVAPGPAAAAIDHRPPQCSHARTIARADTSTTTTSTKNSVTVARQRAGVEKMATSSPRNGND